MTTGPPEVFAMPPNTDSSGYTNGVRDTDFARSTSANAAYLLNAKAAKVQPRKFKG